MASITSEAASLGRRHHGLVVHAPQHEGAHAIDVSKDALAIDIELGWWRSTPQSAGAGQGKGREEREARGGRGGASARYD